jgi:transposase
MEDSHGTLCRNRCVFGTLKRVCCGRNREDLEGGEDLSEPATLVAFFGTLGFAVKRIGLGAGPLSQWLHAGLKRAGFEAVLLETRHVKAALSAMTVKTDRKDAHGLAQLIGSRGRDPLRTRLASSQP